MGIDDFALLKGHTYATLLVDLEAARRPIDVLPGREAAPVARWLADHPEVQIICRDRACLRGSRQNSRPSGRPGRRCLAPVEQPRQGRGEDRHQPLQLPPHRPPDHAPARRTKAARRTGRHARCPRPAPPNRRHHPRTPPRRPRAPRPGPVPSRDQP
ncbi:transposase [Streptomyces narbonensis]|uniref:Transposase n=1 Tax=Streptomyces narbonensis TaxID=67333 RepID=A0ABV3CCU0_9ACTN